MKLLFYTFIIFSALACSHGNHEATVDGVSLVKLKALSDKFQVKSKELLESSNEETMWPSETDCDATLWTGIAVSFGHPALLKLAEYEPGQIHRRPPPSCWMEGNAEQESQSTVSNDMLLGYMMGAWGAKDLGSLQRLADFGEAHNWVMGLPISKPGDVILRPSGYGLLASMIYVLTAGQDDRSYRTIGNIYGPVSADYQKHLQLLSICLDGQVHGKLNDNAYSRLKDLSKSESSDVLAQALWSVYESQETEHAIDLLLDDGTPVPSYVRGSPNYALIHWLKAARLILDMHTEVGEI